MARHTHSKTLRSVVAAELPRLRATPSSVSRRALCIGSVLLLLNTGILFYAEPVRMMWLTNAAPFANVIFLLFLITVANALLARVRPRVALSSLDLIAIYLMLSIQTGLGSMNFLHWLLGSISYGSWGASASNRWAEDYLPHLPAWLLVSDPEALKGYYTGHSTFFVARHVRAWLGPLLWWTLFFYALAATMAAVTVLYSRQWIRKERLSFPVVELPFQMAAGGAAFWRQRRMWYGFAIAAGAELINGLNFLYPAVPQLPLKRLNIGPLLTEPPWNALGETNLSFYPFMVGLAFLIPVDLSISLIVFYFLHKAQLIYGAIVGWNEIPSYPFPYNQQFGAGAAIIVAALWGSRGHLRRVWRVAWSERPTTNARRSTLDAQRSTRSDDASSVVAGAESRASSVERSSLVVRPSPVAEEIDPEERHQYRRCLLTLAIGTLLVPGFMVAAGLDWWMALFVYVMYLFLGIVVSRIRCELGFSLHQMPRMNGPHFLMLANGSQSLGIQNIASLALFNTFTNYNQSHVMPHQFEGLKMADRAGAPLRGITTAMIVAILLAVPATFLIYLAGTYHLGAGSGHMLYGLSGREMYVRYLPAWAQSDVYRQPNMLALGVTAGSFLLSLLLMGLRLRFLGWPLHPIGMAVANSNHDITDVWVPILAGSLLKGVLLHYSGLKGYRQVLPFFLGLIMGDLVMGMTWIALASLLNTPMYQFFL